MKIGLSSAAYYGQLETDEAAAHIAELPLDTCEVFLETPSEYTTDFTFRMRYNMNNFPVTSVHPLGTQFEPQLFGRAARQSDDACGAPSPARAVGERQLVQRRHAGGRAPPAQTHPGRGVRA